MDRVDSLLKHLDRKGRGIEVGPWFNPLVPKSAGFRSYVLDVFDGDSLRQRAAQDPNIPADRIARIEDVDFVGSCTHIDDVVRTSDPQFPLLDWIVSSHNFEHLPNPIRFLQGCARLLRPDGVVSMAIPDHRTCFDFFRPVTMIADWIEGFHLQRDRPSLVQNLNHRAYFAHAAMEGDVAYSFFRDTDLRQIRGPVNLREVYADFVRWSGEHTTEYHDSHCSVFTPSSFELLILDGSYLGLIPFEVIEVSDMGCEFHAHLRHSELGTTLADADFQEQRVALLHRVHDEVAESSPMVRELRAQLRIAEGRMVAPAAA